MFYLGNTIFDFLGAGGELCCGEFKGRLGRFEELALILVEKHS